MTAQATLAFLAVLLLTACGGGAITQTGMRFDQGNLNGSKTLFARVLPRKSTVSDVNLSISGVAQGQPFPDVEIDRAYILQNGNEYTYSNNTLVNFVRSPGDKLTAEWRFSFSGGFWPPNTARDTYEFAIQVNDLAVGSDSIRFQQQDTSLPEEGQQSASIMVGQPFAILVDVTNVGPAFSDAVPVRVLETRPGGSAAPPGSIDEVRILTGGFAAGETRTASFPSNSFDADHIGELRVIRAFVNEPPHRDPVLLEELFNNNVADSVQLSLVGPTS